MYIGWIFVLLFMCRSSIWSPSFTLFCHNSCCILTSSWPLGASTYLFIFVLFLTKIWRNSSHEVPLSHLLIPKHFSHSCLAAPHLLFDIMWITFPNYEASKIIVNLSSHRLVQPLRSRIMKHNVMKRNEITINVVSNVVFCVNIDTLIFTVCGFFCVKLRMTIYK
jgi:hypothetical protein